MKRKLLALSGIVFAAHSISLYAYAAEAAWLNSPSVLSMNEDIQVSGGGAPSSTYIDIKALDDTSGALLSEETVYTDSSGQFELTFRALSDASTVRITAVIDGKELSSISARQ